ALPEWIVRPRPNAAARADFLFEDRTMCSLGRDDRKQEESLTCDARCGLSRPPLRRARLSRPRPVTLVQTDVLAHEVEQRACRHGGKPVWRRKQIKTIAHTFGFMLRQDLHQRAGLQLAPH